MTTVRFSMIEDVLTTVVVDSDADIGVVHNGIDTVGVEHDGEVVMNCAINRANGMIEYEIGIEEY